jgi:transmembrane sensor
VQPDNDRLYLLLDRYLAGEASAEDAETVRRWLADDPAHQGLLEDLRVIRRVTAERVPESGTDAAWARAIKVLAPVRKARVLGRLLVAALAAAAVYIALLGGPGLLRRAPRWSELATAASHRAAARLPDGTQVTLAPQSRLRYASGYGHTHRDVYLEGEAFFQVAYDVRRPFRVHTARTVTEDLATEFLVSAYPDQAATEVIVSEGRVALWPPNLVLGARDLGRLDARGVATVRRGVEVGRYLAWTKGQLVFDATPLRDAVRTLDRWYDVEVRLGDPDSALAARRLTATFTNEPIDLVLQRIALTLGLRVERKDGYLLLLR